MANIIVVHGALGSAAQMQPVAEALRELGAVVVAELPGHGATPLGDRAFSMNTFVSALAGTVDSLSYVASVGDAPSQKPVVFGYSMGGYVALALEAERPGTFGAIVTLGTKFAWTPEIAAQESARLNPRVIEEKIPKFAAILADRHAASGGWHDVLANTRELLEALGDDPLLSPELLSRVAIPVCIAIGDRDETVSASEAAEVSGWMQQGSKAIVTNTPHPIERVSPASVAQLVRDVLRMNIQQNPLQ